jgi:tetratricopeptide (TPR) repeat protein
VTVGLKEAEAELYAALAGGAKDLEPTCASRVLSNLAAAMCASGRFVEGERLAERSVKTLDKVLSPDASELLRPLQILSAARLEQGKLRTARAAFQRMQSIRTERAEYPALVHTMAAALLRAEGRLAEAEAGYREALAEWENAGRGKRADAAAVLTSLGIVNVLQGRLDDAERALDRAMSIITTATDTVPADRIKLLNIRAALHARRGEWKKAREDLQDAVLIADREMQLDPAYLGLLLGHYAQVLRKNHQRKEARSIEARAAAFRGDRVTDGLVDVIELSVKAKANRK